MIEQISSSLALTTRQLCDSKSMSLVQCELSMLGYLRQVTGKVLPARAADKVSSHWRRRGHVTQSTPVIGPGRRLRHGRGRPHRDEQGGQAEGAARGGGGGGPQDPGGGGQGPGHRRGRVQRQGLISSGGCMSVCSWHLVVNGVSM